MNTSYARVIVNPIAGAGGTARKWPDIANILRNLGLHFEYDITEAPRHAIELARKAAGKGYRMVVAVGGDGTVNEVVNGLHAAGSLGKVTLGIISTGTGGDYARTIGLPRTYQEMCQRLVYSRRLQVDLGVVEYADNGQDVQRVFVNLAGMGFDAEIVRRTTQQFKSLGSRLAYLMGLVATLTCYRNHRVSLVIDDEVVSRKVCTVIMNNGRYGGGGMLTAPDASVNDGFFDVLIIGDLSKPDLLWSLPRIYKGTHLTHPKVSMRRAKKIEIRSSDGRLQLQADGELLGQVPARFRILPLALKIVC